MQRTLCNCIKLVFTMKLGQANSSKATIAESNHSMAISNVLHGILGRPFSGCAIVSCPVSLQQLCNVWHQWIVRVGISQQRADGEQDLANSQGRTPLILEDIQADTSVGVDVTVVNTCGEVDFGGLEGIICGEMNIEEENTSGIWRVIGSHDCCLPVEHVITDGAS